jgi:hypothetical protein
MSSVFKCTDCRNNYASTVIVNEKSFCDKCFKNFNKIKESASVNHDLKYHAAQKIKDQIMFCSSEDVGKALDELDEKYKIDPNIYYMCDIGFITKHQLNIYKMNGRDFLCKR